MDNLPDGFGWKQPDKARHELIEAMIEDLVAGSATNAFRKLARITEWDNEKDPQIMKVLTDTFSSLLEGLCDLVDKTGVAIIPESWFQNEDSPLHEEVCESCQEMLKEEGRSETRLSAEEFEKWFKLEAIDPEEEE